MSRVRPQSSPIMSGSCTGAPAVAHAPPGYFVSSNKGAAAMPVYQFAVRWNEDRASDVRYTHLADEAAARRHAKQLANEFRLDWILSLFLSFTCGGEKRSRQRAVLNSIPRDGPLGCCFRSHWPDLKIQVAGLILVVDGTARRTRPLSRSRAPTRHRFAATASPASLRAL